MLSPFRYSGAKNRLLPIIMPYLTPLLTNSSVYYEPFVGGASVALAVANTYPNIQININDKDEWIASFWQILAGDNTALIYDLISLLETPPTIELFYKLANRPPVSLLERAYYILFFNRTTFSGIVKRDKNGNMKSSPIGGKEQKSKYKVDCRYNFPKLKEKILTINNLLHNRTQISNMDIDQYLSQIDKSSPTYLDPPYVKAGEQLYHQHMTSNEHKRLADILKIQSNWILSYDDNKVIRDLYTFANIDTIDANYSINGKKTSWIKKSELIITPKLSGQQS